MVARSLSSHQRTLTVSGNEQEIDLDVCVDEIMEYTSRSVRSVCAFDIRGTNENALRGFGASGCALLRPHWTCVTAEVSAQFIRNIEA
jgi:hypothetical protein